MGDLSGAFSQTHGVTSFQDLVSTPFDNGINAIGWIRALAGDFSEIVEQLKGEENIRLLDEHDLLELDLTEKGHLAREILLNDLQLLKAHGSSPSLNLIRRYDRDDALSFFPTDVYSFHVDRAPVSADTFLCTYYGETSEILPNEQAEQKVLVPEIRDELRKLYQDSDEGFDSFLSDHFFDLHYRAKPGAIPIKLGLGHMWRLAVDHPESKVLPCVHRAPEQTPGEYRLLMIC
jgi:hypothetical protein